MADNEYLPLSLPSAAFRHIVINCRCGNRFDVCYPKILGDAAGSTTHGIIIQHPTPEAALVLFTVGKLYASCTVCLAKFEITGERVSRIDGSVLTLKAGNDYA